jgi:hypothetical protein
MHNLSCFTEISTSLELKHSREAISAIESYSICFHSEILCVDVNMFDSINAGVWSPKWITACIYLFFYSDAYSKTIFIGQIYCYIIYRYFNITHIRKSE